MSDTPQDQVAIATAQGLTDALDGMQRELGAANAYGRRSRHLIIGLAVSFLLDVALTVVVAVFAIQAHDASARAAVAASQASQNHTSALAACRAGNVSRRTEAKIFDALATLTPVSKSGSQSAAHVRLRLAEEAGITSQVKVAYAPRDCARIYPSH